MFCVYMQELVIVCWGRFLSLSLSLSFSACSLHTHLHSHSHTHTHTVNETSLTWAETGTLIPTSSNQVVALFHINLLEPFSLAPYKIPGVMWPRSWRDLSDFFFFLFFFFGTRAGLQADFCSMSIVLHREGGEDQGESRS